MPFTNGHDKSLFTNSGILSCYTLCLFRVSFIGIILEIFFTLVQAYHHASSVIQSLREDNLNLKFLVQIDKLVHLLESPIFAYLRLQVLPMAKISINFTYFFLKLHTKSFNSLVLCIFQLLEPAQYPWLIKSLYGLLMLLPQV